MATYLYCGLSIESNIDIPDLPHSDPENAKLAFHLEKAGQPSIGLSWPIYWQHPGGRVVLAYGRSGSFDWLRFPELADFRMSAAAREISCFPLPGVPEETIAHLLLDQVLPRYLAHQGKLMLHASGVWMDQGMIVFIGSSGAGKSTLAGCFHQAGQRAISDDVLWIKAKPHRPIVAVPSYAGLRLWEDSLHVLFPSEQSTHPMAHYSEKRRIQLHLSAGRSTAGLPILAVIVIAKPNQTINREICLEPLFRRDAFIRILNETFQLDSTDLNERISRMHSLAAMVTRLPLFRLSMPHDYEVLPLVRRKILDAVLQCEAARKAGDDRWGMS